MPPPLPGGIFSLTPSRRDHNSHLRRARAFTIFGLTDGVLVAGETILEHFSGFPWTDQDEIHRIYRKILFKNFVGSGIPDFGF